MPTFTVLYIITLLAERDDGTEQNKTRAMFWSSKLERDVFAGFSTFFPRMVMYLKGTLLGSCVRLVKPEVAVKVSAVHDRWGTSPTKMSDM